MTLWHKFWMNYHQKRIDINDEMFKLGGSFKYFKKVNEHEKKYKKHALVISKNNLKQYSKSQSIQ